jgi:hypothetical protein
MASSTLAEIGIVFHDDIADIAIGIARIPMRPVDLTTTVKSNGCGARTGCASASGDRGSHAVLDR